VNDADNYYLIQNRVLHSSFKFPAKLYNDKRSTTGYRNIHCNREWFKMFSFIYYSEKVDGLFCLHAFFSLTHHIGDQISWSRNPTKIGRMRSKTCGSIRHVITIAAQWRSWMPSLSHANPSNRVDLVMADVNSGQILRNRQVLTSTVKCLELCGRQGTALRWDLTGMTPVVLVKVTFKLYCSWEKSRLSFLKKASADVETSSF